MANLSYCGWANHVNRIILSSTGVTVGDGAIVSDSLESGGQKKSRLVSSNPPDKFSVTMAFDFSTPVYNNYTELDLFWLWYKNVHKFGTVPFEFPAILLNSNRQAGDSQEAINHIINRINNGDTTAKLPDREFYCITSAVNGSKEGLSQKVTMTWETYATSTIQVEDEEYTVDDYSVSENGYIHILLRGDPQPQTLPSSVTWTVQKSTDSGTTWSNIEIKNCAYNSEDNSVYLLYNPLPTGRYLIKIDNKTPKSLVVV